MHSLNSCVQKRDLLLFPSFLFQFLAIIWLFYIHFFSSILNADTNKKHDFQIWNYDSIQGSVSDRVDLYLELSFRWKNNATTFFYNHEHIELPIHISSYLDIGAAYRQTWRLSANPTHDQWFTEYQPNLNITFFWQWGTLYFSDRSRGAYKIFDTMPNVWQYRNKFSVETDDLYNPLSLRYLLSDEIFIEEHRRGIYENRLTSGFYFVVIAPLSLEIAYRLQTIRELNGWHHNNILLLRSMINF